MTREEAISEWTFRSNHIKEWLDEFGEEPSIRHYVELIDMAIEALQTDVVRCENCIQKHIGGSVTQYYWCDFWDREVDCNNGCSWGERKGGDDE